LAALAVLTRHVPDSTLLDLLPGSALAVDLFFVLSGFVLAHAYIVRLQSQMTPWMFMRVRMIRLYPLYILGSAIGTVHFLLASGIDPWAWIKIAGCALFAIFFVPTFPALSPDAHPFPLNFPAWSLFYELLINFVFAFLVLRMTKWLLIAVIGIGLVLIVSTGLYFGDLYSGSRFDNFWGGGGRVVYSFFMGVAAYRLWQNDRLSWIRIPAPVSMLLLLATFAAEPGAGGQSLLRSVRSHHHIPGSSARFGAQRANGLFLCCL
jgi:peptidoglycan/LPS O-acetylase OafA/YrhL